MVLVMLIAALAGKWLDWSQTASNIAIGAGAFLVVLVFTGLEGFPRAPDGDEKHPPHLG
jgi:hypothetical protein